MKEKKKMGRPLTANQIRNIRFTVRMAENEHQEIKKQAEKYNMTIAEYIRYLVKEDIKKNK